MLPVDDTSSPTSLNIAKQWLSTCLDEHKCSNWHGASRTAEGIQNRPSRLIDVKAFGDITLDVRLVDGYDVPDYLTLSHCWGRAPACTTTSWNLAQHMERIQHEDLSKTFQDAIKITRDLGYRYIWIDALCIVQGCEEDWAREGSKMESIFSNCILCITATSGTDGTSGCFSPNPSGRTEILRHLVNVTNVLSDGSESTLSIYDGPIEALMEGFNAPKMIRDSPAATRGWMLQERLLAPRTLHFTTEQIFWECGVNFKAQDGLESSYWYRDSFDFTEVHHRTGPRLARELANVDGASSSFQIILRWYNEVIAANYSKRLLSFPNDKLPAVSGLARLVGRSIQSRYIAGLWEYALGFGLCWRVVTPASSKAAEVQYRAPSFSWASVDTQVDWLPFTSNLNFPPSCLLTVLKWSSIPSTSDQFGRVSSAELKVTGEVKMCRILPRQGNERSDNAGESMTAVENIDNSSVWMDTVTLEDSFLSLLVCVTRWPSLSSEMVCALLLGEEVGTPGIFKRRGLACFPTAALHSYHVTTITLI
jgi:hypothetical protein